MNILFMSLGEFKDLSQGSVHIDVVKELSKNNNVFLVCKSEKRDNEQTRLAIEDGINILRVKTGNVKKTSLIKKGFSTMLLEYQFDKAIKKIFSDIKFDAVIYTTPPITFVRPIKFIKRRDKATTYLMLKDIFPQNAVDLGMMVSTGPKAAIYKFFRKKERELYLISDKIGCMSPANMEYVLRHNKNVPAKKIELFPNCINVKDTSISNEEKQKVRTKYNLPPKKKVFVYGGNLGKPQGIGFVKKCLYREKDNDEAFFLIVGSGTEFDMLDKHIDDMGYNNVRLIESLPKNEYDLLISACDVGLIFLDYRFTIPNFPARTLSYMQARIPVLAVTDSNTDLGEIVVRNEFGWWTKSDDVEGFHHAVVEALNDNTAKKGNNGYNYCLNNHNVAYWCDKLLDYLEKVNEVI